MSTLQNNCHGRQWFGIKRDAGWFAERAPEGVEPLSCLQCAECTMDSGREGKEDGVTHSFMCPFIEHLFSYQGPSMESGTRMERF